MAVWQWGGNPPVFNGPDLSPYSVLSSSTSYLNMGVKFSVDEGPLTFAHIGTMPVGITLDSATGIYSFDGTMVAGTYPMQTKAYGVDGTIGSPTDPPSEANYTWTLIVNQATNAPAFAGPIDNQDSTTDYTLDCSSFFTGATSYSISPAVPAGITFNTTTGLITVAVATAGVGQYGPFVVTATNSTGSTPSNSFSLTVTADTSGGPVYIAIPSLIGLLVADAGDAAAQVGFVLDTPTYGYDTTAAEGTVMLQIPTAGVLAIAGTHISVVVSKGIFKTWTPVAKVSPTSWVPIFTALDTPPSS